MIYILTETMVVLTIVHVAIITYRMAVRSWLWLKGVHFYAVYVFINVSDSELLSACETSDLRDLTNFELYADHMGKL